MNTLTLKAVSGQQLAPVQHVGSPLQSNLSNEEYQDKSQISKSCKNCRPAPHIANQLEYLQCCSCCGSGSLSHILRSFPQVPHHMLHSRGPEHAVAQLPQPLGCRGVRWNRVAASQPEHGCESIVRRACACACTISDFQSRSRLGWRPSSDCHWTLGLKDEAFAGTGSLQASQSMAVRALFAGHAPAHPHFSGHQSRPSHSVAFWAEG